MGAETIYIERLRQGEDGALSWVKEPVSVDTTNFSINENDIESDIVMSGQQLAFYGKICAELRAELERKEEHLNKVYAFASLKYRKKAEDEKIKSTDKSIDAQILTDLDYNEALLSLQVSRLYAYQAENWWRAIQKRSELLVAFTYKKTAELKKLIS